MIQSLGGPGLKIGAVALDDIHSYNWRNEPVRSKMYQVKTVSSGEKIQPSDDQWYSGWEDAQLQIPWDPPHRGSLLDNTAHSICATYNAWPVSRSLTGCWVFSTLGLWSVYPQGASSADLRATMGRDWKVLSRMPRTAEKAIRTSLPWITDIYNQRCRARWLIKDFHHPRHRFFTVLPSGKLYQILYSILFRYFTLFC